jgi:hypothetical protein
MPAVAFISEAVQWTATAASTKLMESWMRRLGGACERDAEGGAGGGDAYAQAIATPCCSAAPPA